MSTEKLPLAMPGRDVVFGLIMTLNTEDAGTVSKELVHSGEFSWTGYINTVGYVRAGMTPKYQ